jgi:DNA-binding MarR family transcriptional regulator
MVKQSGDPRPDGFDAAAFGREMGRELSTAVVLFHEAVGERLGLSAADHRALGIVSRAGPMTAGDLARLTGLTPGAVTGLVDRLERAGHVRRTADPADRRRILIEVIPDQSTGFGDAFAELGAEMSRVMAKYDERERAAIADWIVNTIAVLRAQTKRLTADPADAANAPDAADTDAAPP